MTTVAHGDIEHVSPKSVKPELTFRWANLTFACQICNQNKGNKEVLVDPYSEDPKQELIFLAPLIKGRSAKGVSTVLALKLNRPPLLEARLEAISRFAEFFEKVVNTEDVALRELLIQDLEENVLNKRSEFSATIKAFWESYKESALGGAQGEVAGSS